MVEVSETSIGFLEFLKFRKPHLVLLKLLKFQKSKETSTRFRIFWHFGNETEQLKFWELQ